MSVRDTTGVSGVARIFLRACPMDRREVAELARERGLARSTAFALARRLEAAQFVARDPTGKLIAGPRRSRLGFARFGLARLHGPAEALLGWLRDHCDATATLSCDRGRPRDAALLQRDGAKPRGAAATLSYAIREAAAARPRGSNASAPTSASPSARRSSARRYARRQRWSIICARSRHGDPPSRPPLIEARLVRTMGRA